MTITPSAERRSSNACFIGISTLLAAASAGLTVLWCGSMAAAGSMPMPGGWTMSMAWMRMPGQTWSGAAASFIVMWTVMMVAMMLPWLIPVLRRYRDLVKRVEGRRVGRLTALVGLGYFAVWTLCGVVAFPVGAGLAALTMRQPLARGVPLAAGVVVLIASAMQFTAWKARHLACCRDAPRPGDVVLRGAGAAWQYGVRLGVHCGCSGAGLTAILLVVGVMDLRAMAVVMAATTFERLAPSGERAARGLGVVVAGAASLMIARAVGF
jgi:predicted metal-binding membrane protein